jgi:hypothetical protein
MAKVSKHLETETNQKNMARARLSPPFLKTLKNLVFSK